MSRPMTRTELHEVIAEHAEVRRLSVEAETLAYRMLNDSAARSERASEVIDTALDILSDRAHAEDPIDPTDPAGRAAIAAAWADFEPEPVDPTYARAQRAIAGVIAHLCGLLPVEVGVQALPGLARDAHGCWVSDLDDPQWADLPEARIGCAVEWAVPA